MYQHVLKVWLCSLLALTFVIAKPSIAEELPKNLRVALDATKPVEHARNGRLPLYVLPISGSLKGTNDELANDSLRQLDRRAIGYSVECQHSEFE